jgi:hypothetical protein
LLVDRVYLLTLTSHTTMAKLLAEWRKGTCIFLGRSEPNIGMLREKKKIHHPSMPYYLRCLKITFPKEATLALLSRPSGIYKWKTRAARLKRICTGMLSRMRRSSPDFRRGRYSDAISFTYPETGAIRPSSRIQGIKLRKCDSVFTFDSGTRSTKYLLVRQNMSRIQGRRMGDLPVGRM